jgi:hypothetical protein
VRPIFSTSANCLRLASERLGEVVHGPGQALEGPDQGDLGGRRIGVVGRLGLVDVVERVDGLVAALGVPEDLQGEVGDDLVGVHVGRRAGTALDVVDDELVVQLPASDALAGGGDRMGLLGIELAEVPVRQGGGFLDGREGIDELVVHADFCAADVEVLQRALGVDSPVGVGGNREVPEEVVLYARLFPGWVGIRLVCHGGSLAWSGGEAG